MIITVFVYIKKGFTFTVATRYTNVFVLKFTFTVKRFHIYGALLHFVLKVFTFIGPYYIFTFRGATMSNCVLVTFPCGFMSQGNLIVSIPNLCPLSYFKPFCVAHVRFHLRCFFTFVSDIMFYFICILRVHVSQLKFKEMT